ncbi:MAG: phospholipase [Actinomycetota bacterium]|nr:phospholipase [Actinomycetota bacterium]
MQVQPGTIDPDGENGGPILDRRLHVDDVRGAAAGGRRQLEGVKNARNGKLPAVSWIICTSTASEHPQYTPKIDAIEANPEVWTKTVFILNYDENDGLRHPGRRPPGRPAIVVSPWTAGGWVCSENFDPTSTLRFLERVTGVAEPNTSQWRRKTFGDMTSAFRFNDHTSQPPVLPDTSGPLTLSR